MKQETAKRLRDVVDACHELQNFCSGKSRDDLYADRTLQLVVQRLLEIVGEALRRAELSDHELIEQIPDVRDIVGTRNRLIHGYDDVNYSLIWDVVEIYVPSLEQTVESLLANDASNSSR